MQRIPELDGLRALAILPVLATHLMPYVPGGYLGVDLFFVLSGFLITSLLVDEERREGSIDLPAFYKRRALRILPPLILTIALAIAITPTRMDAAFPALFFFSNFVLPLDPLGSLGHTWSLSVEEQFYVLWPVLFLFARMPAIALAVVVPLIARANTFDTAVVYASTLTRMDSLAIGCVAAMLPSQVTHRGFAALAVIAIGVCFVAAPASAFFAQPYGFTMFALLCAGAILSAREIPILRNPVLRYIGQRSYGLYLYHFPIFHALETLRHHGDPLNYAWVAALKLLLTFAFAEVSYRTLERWTMKLRHPTNVSTVKLSRI